MANTGLVHRFGTKAELTIDTPRAGELVFATDSGEFGYLNDISALIWINFQDYYKKAEYVSLAGDASDAGKPVVLNGEGYIDDTMLKTHAFVLIGNFTPVEGAGLEYPDTTGLEVGSFWVIDGVDIVSGFTFTYGDMIGEIVYNNDQLLLAHEGFVIQRGAINAEAYYKLDGSKALEADFDGGGFKISNIANGDALSDAVTVEQWNTKFDGLTSNANMVVEVGADFITKDTTPDAQNLLGYSILSDGSYFDGATQISLGDMTTTTVIGGVVIDSILIDNDRSLMAWDENYTFAKDLIKRTDDGINTGNNGDYNSEVIVGDVDVVTALRATTGFDPVVRKGSYGSSDDYKIYTEEDFALVDFATTVHTHASTDITDIANFTTSTQLSIGLSTKLDIPQGAQTAYYVVASNSANNGIVWAEITKDYIGLANVDNTSDLNKPISTSTQTALDGKIDDAQVLTDVPVGALFTDTTYPDVTSTTGGVLTDLQAVKLDALSIPLGGTTRPVDPLLYTTFWDETLNASAGALITCTDNTTSANVWKYSDGTTVV